MASIKSAWKAFAAGYTRFVEHQGFMIILMACIGVIAGTAAWTNQAPPPLLQPTPPVGDAASVAQLQQQSLWDAATPTPAPTAAPLVFQPPLETISVLRSFDAARCAAGDPVRAMAAGTVTAASTKGLMGATVTIDHGQGITAQYAGMAMLAALREGDPVEVGQTIGFGGNGVLDETDLEPHLHLRVTRNGTAVDPLTLLQN